MNRLSKFSSLTTAVILIAGFFLLDRDIVDYGWTFFLVFPTCIGFAIGTHSKEKKVFLSMIVGILVFMGFLLILGFEGMVCVLMALPLFLIMVGIGYLVQYKIVKRPPRENKDILISFTPLLILLLLTPIERMIVPEPEVVSIVNTAYLAFPPEAVFDAVKQMDQLTAEKPIGLKIGLPSPYKCELYADTIGAQRHCFFKKGKIIAEITEYERGEILKMDVIDYTLTGRKWFQFVDATYAMEADGDGTLITRTSSYRSILHPRFYWQPLETWGIEQEHTFVLNSLKKNLVENSYIIE